MAYTQNAKKLYFNLSWAGGSTASNSPTKFIPCTPFRPSVSIGDRYGSLLPALEALTGNAPNNTKRLNAVTAWFVPDQDNVNGNSTGTVGVFIDFVAPTLAANGGVNNNNVPLLPYLSANGGIVLRNYGKESIYGTLGGLRHFSVRVRRVTNPVNTSSTLSGVLYVQRQHSIEV